MLSRPFLVLYLAVFVATMGISMVSPLLPVFAEQLGATGILIGVTFSIFAVTMMLISPFAGTWSDRFGRKRFIVAGLLVYFIAALGYLTADTLAQVIVFRAFSGLGTSLIFAVGRAYVADFVPRGQEGRYFGVYITSDLIGFGVGPLLAGVVREFAGFDAVFIAMASLMGSATLIVGTLLPGSTEEGRRAVDADPGAGPRPGVRQALRDRLVLGLMVAMAFSALSFGSTFSFLAVRLEGLGVGAAMVGVAFALNSIATGVSQPVTGWLADRLDRRRMATVGMLGSAALMVGLGLGETPAILIAFLTALGVLNAVAFVAAAAMQVEAGRRAGMGVVQGVTSAGDGGGILLGSVGGGLTVELLDTSAAFHFGGIAIVCGTLLFLWLTKDEDVGGRVRRVEEVPSPATREARSVH